MKRRGFLASLFAGAGAVVASKRATAAPVPLPEPEPDLLPEDLRVRASVLPTGRTGMTFKEPAGMACELPILADEGDACFVTSEDRIYVAVIDEPEKLVDTSRAGFGAIRHPPDEVFEGGMTVVIPAPRRQRRPGHWIPVVGAGS